jgi:DNA-binding CsgD family transcriptional regulator
VKSQQVSRVLDLADEMARATTREQLVRSTVEGVHRVIACDRVGWNEVDLASGRVVIELDEDWRTPWVLPTLIDHRALPLPFVTWYEQHRVLGTVTLADLVDRRWRSSTTYNELYRPMRTEHQLGAALLGDDSYFCGLVLNRGSTSFTDDEVLALDLLRPTMQAAAHGLAQAERVDALLGALGGDAVLLETGLRGQAARVPETEAADRLRDIGLDPARPSGQAALHELFDGIPQGGAVSYRGSLLVRLSQPGSGSLVVAVQQSSGRPRELTPRQWEVLTHILAGVPSKTVAGRLGVSRRTVEKHLQDAYGRLGVGSRLEALHALVPTGAARDRGVT